ncbi:phosphatase PAP2 family protein [soil metagenome]
MIHLYRRASTRPEILLALAFGIAASVTLAVLKFASEVMEGDTAALDGKILVILRQATQGDTPLRDALRAMMLDLTALGDVATLTIVVLLAAGFLIAARRGSTAVFFLVEVMAGSALVNAMKALVDRGRPDVVEHLGSFQTASFPSGHAAQSAIVYLSLAILVVRVVPGRAARIYVIVAAGLLTVAIGLSRLYLGVHWPSDVLAGWAIGSGWALMVALLAQAMHLRRSG